MKKNIQKQRGSTLVEMSLVVLILGMLFTGYATQTKNANIDLRNSVEGQQLQTVSKAAKAYISDNYSSIMGVATASAPALIRISDLISTGYLQSGFSTKDAYQNDMCILVLQPSAGKLNGLVITEGTNKINDVDLSKIVTSTGAAGGAIYSDATTTIKGARGGWSTPVGNFANANQLGQNCSGAAGKVQFTDGHAYVALWFQNNDQTAGFLYRQNVPGRPELNQMNTAIDMQTNNIDKAGNVDAGYLDVRPQNTTSKGGEIQLQGAGGNKKTVIDNYNGVTRFHDGTTSRFEVNMNNGDTTITGQANLNGGARLQNGGVISSPGRMHIEAENENLYLQPWSGTTYIGYGGGPGNLNVGGTTSTNVLELRGVVSEGSGCSPNGLVARDGAGKILSCQSGVWKSGGSLPAWMTYTGSRSIYGSSGDVCTAYYNGNGTYTLYTRWYYGATSSQTGTVGTWLQNQDPLTNSYWCRSYYPNRKLEAVFINGGGSLELPY